MRIAFIAVKGLPFAGGIEKLTEEIGSRLARRGHEVIVYSSRDFAGAPDGEYRGMKIRTVPSINTRSMHKLSICLAATMDVLAGPPVDIVHVHAVGPSLFALFPRLRGIPTVVQAHGIEWRRDKWGPAGKAFLRLSDYTAAYFPHRLTVVSRVLKRYYEEKFGREAVYIPTGVNPAVARKPDWLLRQGLEPGRYVLFAARLVEEKGAHFLIEAFRGLDTKVKLVVAGDAPHESRYRGLLREMASGDPRISMPGFVTGEPLEELLGNALLFCLPSTVEGLPIALLEAMSHGNCCVVSDIPENLEALGGEGFTFRNRDSWDLRRVLGRLIQDSSLIEEKKEPARERALTHYSWDSVTDRMEDLYLSVAGAAGKDRRRKAAG